MLTRRDLLAASALATFLARLTAQGPPLAAAPGPLTQVQTLVQAFMKSYAVPGLSLAYGRGNRLLLAQAYGAANKEPPQAVTARSLFRIASLSKAITSAAIFTLVQAGKVRLNDRVFGQGAVLSRLPVPHPSLEQITVRHLLTHTAGGWSNEQHDPMFHSHDSDQNAFLQHTLRDYPLSDQPGTAYAYSNFGYFVLGRVIEQISGQPYGEYVQQHVFQPLGIQDMLLGATRPAPQEVHYYGQGQAKPYDFRIALHDANGGWLATAPDLVRFALGVFSVEDRAGAPALLSQTTLNQLKTPSPANPRYACGWGVSPDGDFTHSGALPGSTTLLMHRHDGLAWALLTNTQRPRSPMAEDMRQLSWSIARLLPGA